MDEGYGEKQTEEELDQWNRKENRKLIVFTIAGSLLAGYSEWNRSEGISFILSILIGGPFLGLALWFVWSLINKVVTGESDLDS
jgi:hypothetical protein